MGAKIKESEFMKALDDLERFVEKGGDPLMAADTEGGLSTEGEPLSKKAPKGYGGGKVAKMMSASDESSSSEDESDDDAEKAEIDEDGEQVAKADDSSEEEDDDSSSSEPAEKSLRARAEENTSIRKGLEVSTFLDGLTTTFSDTVEDLRKSVNGDISELRDERRNFDRRLAKAFVMMGKELEESRKSLAQMQGTLQKILNSPASGQRPRVLEKSDLVEPNLADSDPLYNIPAMSITNWLVNKVEKGEIDQMELFSFEAGSYDPRGLSLHVQKALVNDLVK